MSKSKPKRYAGKCGPMPALGCTIRCIARRGLIPHDFTISARYKDFIPTKIPYRNLAHRVVIFYDLGNLSWVDGSELLPRETYGYLSSKQLLATRGNICYQIWYKKTF